MRYWYRAGGPENRFHAEKQEFTVLAIRGRDIDKVVWISNTLNARSLSVSEHRHARLAQTDAEPYIDKLWDQVCIQMAELGVVPKPEDFLLTLVQGFPMYDSTTETLHMLAISAYLEAVGSKLPLLAAEVLKVVRKESLAEIYHIEAAFGPLGNFGIVITSNGRMGLLPVPTTLIGDTLCIFHGVSVPFVLAPTVEGRFKLVGQAYVQGVMNGELVGHSEAEMILLE